MTKLTKKEIKKSLLAKSFWPAVGLELRKNARIRIFLGNDASD